jgi:hypothetical protein
MKARFHFVSSLAAIKIILITCVFTRDRRAGIALTVSLRYSQYKMFELSSNFFFGWTKQKNGYFPCF